jgi:hypothetical protein
MGEHYGVGNKVSDGGLADFRTRYEQMYRIASLYMPSQFDIRLNRGHIQR